MTYFGESGLTSTSANYIANKAKELANAISAKLSNISLYKEEVTLVGAEGSSVTKVGTPDAFDHLTTEVTTLGNLKALMAWLREAIKERGRLYANVFSQTTNDAISALVAPIRKPDLTQDEVIATWPVAKRNRYLALEAKASVYGKLVGPDGTLNIARKEYLDILSNPTVVQGKGRDMLIYKKTPLFGESTVEERFFELQTKWRSLESELNQMKHEIEETILADSVRKRAEYERAYTEYDSQRNRLLNEFTKDKEERLKEILALKIVIPDELKETYQLINNLGK